MQRISRCSLDEWATLAHRIFPTDVSPYLVRDASGSEVVLRAQITEHKDVTILGADHVPVHASGKLLVDQMVHTPLLFPKAWSHVKRGNDGWYCDLSNVKRVAEDLVLIGGSPNYYHWLIDYLPRLILAMRAADLRRYRLLVHDELAPFQLDSIRALGFSSDQLCPMSAAEDWAPRSILIPTFLAGTTVAHPVVPRFLNETYIGKTARRGRRVYLSRQEASSRRLVNEGDLIDLLTRRGFEVHRPGMMSFGEQVNLFASASIVVAVHGAGMANIAFCPRGARVFEIYSTRYRVTSMYMLSLACGHQHHFVPADNVTFGADGNPLLGDWRVDIGAMENALKTNGL